MLKSWVSTALEQLNSVQQELEILQHMAKMKKTETQHPGEEGASMRRNEPPPQQQRKVMYISLKKCIKSVNKKSCIYHSL